MFELIKKDTPFKILWQDIILKQLTYYECIEFQYNFVNYWIAETLYEFLKDKMVITKQDFIKINIDDLFTQIKKTIMRGFYSNIEKTNTETVPLESYFDTLCGWDMSKIDTILNYTPEKINYLINWRIYNNNELTPVWKNKNRINQEIKNTPKEEKDKILKNVEYIDNLINNK